MADQYNPAAEGMRAAREDDIRMELAKEKNRAAAAACAEDAHLNIAEIIERLLEADEYLKSGNHLAAIGAFCGVPQITGELSFLMRRLQRKVLLS